MSLKQCKFQNGNSFTTGFIPEWAAKVDNIVEIKELDGLWKIIEVYENSDDVDVDVNEYGISNRINGIIN